MPENPPLNFSLGHYKYTQNEAKINIAIIYRYKFAYSTVYELQPSKISVVASVHSKGAD